MIPTSNWCACPSCPTRRPHHMETSRPPPTWLIGWRLLVSFILKAEMTLVKFLLQTVRLGLRPRSWIAHCDPIHQQMCNSLLEQVTAPCKHPPASMARSGNQHGSFCRCTLCGTRWRYTLGAWEELPSSQQLQLPQPSATSSARPIWARQLAPDFKTASSTGRATTARTHYVPGAKASKEDRQIPQDGVDPGRPLALTRREKASLARGAPSEEGPLRLSQEELQVMEAQAAEIDRKRQEVADYDLQVAQMEARSSLASARAKAAARAVVPAEDTASDEDFDWSLVADPLKAKPLKAGTRIWITGHLRQARDIYQNEIDTYEAQLPFKEVANEPRVDLLELGPGAGQLIDLAGRYGLSAVQPLETDPYGEPDPDFVMQVLRRLRPLCVVCLASASRPGQHPTLPKELVRNVCQEQSNAGRLFLCDGSLYPEGTVEYTFEFLADIQDFVMCEGDCAAYGQENAEGLPSTGSRRWATNSNALASVLSVRLEAGQEMYCGSGQPVAEQGGFHHCILEGLLREARVRFPSRFAIKEHEVFFAKPSPSPEAWKTVLDDIEARFMNTHKKPFYLNGGDPIFQAVRELVPWEISRIQAAWTPQARRLPQEFPYTHRGAAMRLANGDFDLEAEDLASVSFPKRRFVKAVRVAVFFYGVPRKQEAPDADEEPGAEQEGAHVERPHRGQVPGRFSSRQPVPGMDTEIDTKLQASLARLHVNMGHAPRAELIRMLAAAGNLSGKVLSALDALRCGSCLRTRLPKQPPPSGLPSDFNGFFGEVLQADLVYLRTVDGKNYPVLGVTCEATSYHVAVTVPNKSPSTILKTILESWYRPLGLPLKFRCDPGGEFGGEVIQFHMRHGVIHDVIPAEAHHRLGKIERRNALLRSIVERIVDERGIATQAELDQCLVAATFTMNSCTYSHGRSPYQAVFGRIPRPLGDLLSDPLSLVISPEQQVLRPEILRADAMKALAEHTASSHIKRALLRKTRHQIDLNRLQPGQPIAFWRWSGRSRQHKRGAWSLARFVSVDPDGKSIWAQVNTTTIKIASNQLRMACGWEEWCPSQDDIRVLKDAEMNMRDNMWSDMREEPPGALEEATQELAKAMPPPMPEQEKDFWRLSGEEAVRIHQVPRHTLYVPDDASFDFDNLTDERQTLMLGGGMPYIDNWRQEGEGQRWEQAWTGTTTFKWRFPSTGMPSSSSGAMPAPLPLRLPASSARTATPSKRSSASKHQELQQTNVQQEQHQELHQTNVQQEVLNQYVDNRSVTMHLPASPVPPTPRNRRGRSRTPSRKVAGTSGSPGAVRGRVLPQDAEDSAGLAPLTPGTLPFSPGVPETPPFSPPAPGTPDYNHLPAEQRESQPTPSGNGAGSTIDNGDTAAADNVNHHEHYDAAAHAGQGGDTLDPGPLDANQFSSAAAASTSSSEAADTTTQQASGRQGQQEDPLPLLPQKRTADALFTSGAYRFFFDDFAEGVLETEPETDFLPVPFHRDSWYRAYLASQARRQELRSAGVPEEPERHDASSDDEELTVSNNRELSRQELKQLDREIPWAEIMKLPVQSLEKYLDAVRNEEENWMRWGGVKPLSRQEAQRVLQDTKLSRRILRSRAAYRDKNKGLGEIKAKCRVVLIGCQDPDMFQLSRDSPTPTRLSEALVLLIATAGANREFNNEAGRWKLWISDAKSAFLQGERNHEERAGPLFMRPPRDPLMQATGAFSAELYEVLGNCFGLPDAPRVWNQKVHRRLTEKGFVQHGFEKCLYYFTDDSGRLRALMIVHVDDFLCTFHQDFDQDILRDMFVWGSVTIVETNQPGSFRGKEINLVARGQRYVYKVTQEAFIQGMATGKLSKGRSKLGDKLTPEEWREFRSISGSLQWLASQTRPEVSPVVSLSNRGSETTYLDLRRLYETVDYLKATPHNGLVYQDVPVNVASLLVTYTDSSWANAGLKSQYGLFVTLAPPQATEVTTKATVLDWKSGRSTRVCRSTLAAEASAADEGADRSAFANLCLSELLYNEPAYKVGCRLNNKHVVDAKSLYDCIVSENPNVSDKRSLVNIRSVQQTVSPKDIHWVPTSIMHADGLTKLDSNLLLELSSWLAGPTVQLRDRGEPKKILGV